MTIKEARNLIFTRDGNKCRECGSTELLCLDHIVPKPRFQLHSTDNLRTLCLKCNFRKQTRILPLEELLSIYSDIYEANERFDEEEIAEMNTVLHEYFTQPPKKQRRKKDETYVWHKKKDNLHMPLWKQLGLLSSERYS